MKVVTCKIKEMYQENSYLRSYFCGSELETMRSYGRADAGKEGAYAWGNTNVKEKEGLCAHGLKCGGIL